MDDFLHIIIGVCIIGTFIKYLKVKNIIKIVFILIILSSCSPRARFARLIKKHPELVKTDTIKVPELQIQEKIVLKKDTVRFDSLLYEFITVTDTIIKEKIKKELYKGAYKDTTYIKSDSLYTANISWKNGILEASIIVKAKSIPCNCPSYSVWNFKEFWILGVICFLLVMLLLYKLIR